MAVTSGFYNSVSGDRKYNALQMSSIFDGIIEDGVYSTIGDHFSVTAGTGNTIIVGTGRAWFNHTWTLNDADYPVTLEPSEVVLNRYDAIVIEVNGSNTVRGNSIKVIKGTPGSSPSKPSLAKGDNNIWQHPLAYVYVPAGSSSISQSNIEYVVGKSECPFVVAAVQSVNIDALVAQWQDEFDTWFDNLEYQLSGDVAGNLQNQINQKVDKSNVIDNLEDLVANQADGMVAGTKAVAKLNADLADKLTWTMIREVSGGGFGSQSIDLSKYSELMLTVGPFAQGDTRENSRVLASTIIPVSLLKNVLGKTDPDGVFQVVYSGSNSRMFGGMNYYAENTVQIRASGSDVKTMLWAR